MRRHHDRAAVEIDVDIRRGHARQVEGEERTHDRCRIGDHGRCRIRHHRGRGDAGAASFTTTTGQPLSRTRAADTLPSTADLEPAAAAGPDDDQIGVALVRGVEDALGRRADATVGRRGGYAGVDRGAHGGLCRLRRDGIDAGGGEGGVDAHAPQLGAASSASWTAASSAASLPVEPSTATTMVFMGQTPSLGLGVPLLGRRRGGAVGAHAEPRFGFSASAAEPAGAGTGMPPAGQPFTPSCHLKERKS